MEDFLVDLDDWGFLLLGGFGSRPGMALLSEVRLRIKTLTDWRAICIFKKCERFFTLPIHQINNGIFSSGNLIGCL